MKKTVIQPSERFVDTGVKLYGGATQPVVTTKVPKSQETKPQVTKQFAKKKFSDERSCAYEKLAYDLLELCGVKVPKTYILADENNEFTLLVSRIEPGYKNLLDWCGGSYNLETIEKNLSNQCISSNQKTKPIVGLYENLAVFNFLHDWDAIGGSLTNVGLIEFDEYFQLVKIDPGQCDLVDRFGSLSQYQNEDYLKGLKALLDGSEEGFIGSHRFVNMQKPYTAIFKKASPLQIMDGLERVSSISDEALRSVIFNEKIPTLSLEEREDIFTLLIRRRNDFQALVAKYSLTQDPEKETKEASDVMQKEQASVSPKQSEPTQVAFHFAEQRDSLLGVFSNPSFKAAKGAIITRSTSNVRDAVIQAFEQQVVHYDKAKPSSYLAKKLKPYAAKDAKKLACQKCLMFLKFQDGECTEIDKKALQDGKLGKFFNEQAKKCPVLFRFIGVKNEEKPDGSPSEGSTLTS